jgi:drug/metabolite transporter (DMT)-like permease
MRLALALGLAIVCAAAGDILFSKGMQSNGAVRIRRPWDVFLLVKQVLTNPFVLVGAFSMAIHLMSYTAALAWVDVSVANPLTALSYVIATAYAVFIMKENVNLGRWSGIFFITFGAILVGLSS